MRPSTASGAVEPPRARLGAGAARAAPSPAESGRPDVAARLALACGPRRPPRCAAASRTPSGRPGQLAEALGGNARPPIGAVRPAAADRDPTVRGAAAREPACASKARPRAASRITASASSASSATAMPYPSANFGAQPAPRPARLPRRRRWPGTSRGPDASGCGRTSHLDRAALASLHTTLHDAPARLSIRSGARPEADLPIATDGQAYRLVDRRAGRPRLRDLLRLAAEARERESGDEQHRAAARRRADVRGGRCFPNGPTRTGRRAPGTGAAHAGMDARHARRGARAERTAARGGDSATVCCCDGAGARGLAPGSDARLRRPPASGRSRCASSTPAGRLCASSSAATRAPRPAPCTHRSFEWLLSRRS